MEISLNRKKYFLLTYNMIGLGENDELHHQQTKPSSEHHIYVLLRLSNDVTKVTPVDKL